MLLLKTIQKGVCGRGMLYIVSMHIHQLLEMWQDLTGSTRLLHLAPNKLRCTDNDIYQIRKTLSPFFWSGSVHVCFLDGMSSYSFPTGSDWKWNAEFISAYMVWHFDISWTAGCLRANNLAFTEKINYTAAFT